MSAEGDPVPAFTDRELDRLKAEADYAARRYELYKARTYGLRPTSAKRMEAYRRGHEGAADRLQRARRARASQADAAR